jgi:hypothetical protein
MVPANDEPRAAKPLGQHGNDVRLLHMRIHQVDVMGFHEPHQLPRMLQVKDKRIILFNHRAEGADPCRLNVPVQGTFFRLGEQEYLVALPGKCRHQRGKRYGRKIGRVIEEDIHPIKLLELSQLPAKQ